MRMYNKFLVAVVLGLPMIVSAKNLNETRELIGSARGIVSALITLVGAIALLAFFWGLARFIFRVGGDEKAVSEGKTIMKWGLVALFVMISVWGIIQFFQQELGLIETIDPESKSQPVPQTFNPYEKYQLKP